MKNLICAVTLLSCVNLVYAFEPAPSNYEIPINHDFKLVSQAKQEENASGKYTINIKYPQLMGSNLTPSVEHFNHEMEQYVTAEITEFKNKTIDAEEEAKNVPPSVDKNALQVTFQAGVFNVKDNKIISIRFNKENSFAGEAHPSHDIEVYNYDLTSGKKILISDLFKSETEYLKVVSGFCYKELSKRFKNADEQVLEKGTAPKQENYTNWTLTPDGILISFDEYQVASYVDGQPEVFIPYKVLKNILLPGTIIEACIKNPKQCSAV